MLPRKKGETLKIKPRTKGEQYRPTVTVQKVKQGIPTKISFNGHEYALIHSDYVNGRKGKK